MEAYSFGIRKNVLEMDNVMNQQRATLYGLRLEILAGEGFDKRVRDSVEHGDRHGRSLLPGDAAVIRLVARGA